MWHKYEKITVIVVGIMLVQVATLYIFGQPIICECGYIKLWEGIVLSSGNSQHITDWYTFSHVIHGFLFYFFLWALFPKMPVWKRLLIAVTIEVTWEIIENTPMVINHYRKQALAQGYVGDSILNSLFDTLFMFAGFVMAKKIPIWSVILIALGFEIFTGIVIKDNLALNIINLLYPLDFIANWQAG